MSGTDLDNPRKHNQDNLFGLYKTEMETKSTLRDSPSHKSQPSSQTNI